MPKPELTCPNECGFHVPADAQDALDAHVAEFCNKRGKAGTGRGGGRRASR